MRFLNFFVTWLFLSCFGIVTIKGQTIEISEKIERFSSGMHNAVVVFIPEADDREVSKAWKRFCRDTGGKVKGNREIFVEGARIEAITLRNIEIYSMIDEGKEGTVLTVGFDLGTSYLSSVNDPEAFEIAKKMLYDFALETSRESVAEDLEDAEKEYEKLEKDYDRLRKEKSRLESDIKKWEKDIVDAKEDIKNNEKEQEKTKDEIARQEKVVKKINEKMNDIK